MEAKSARNEMRMVLVTGLSGAGKSHAMNYFEDLGYYCVDNMPPAFIPTFADLLAHSEGRINKAALVCDMRGGAFFEDLFSSLLQLEEKGIDYEILFLVADDEVLIRRYKETRRRHPLSELSLPEAIKKERAALSELRGKADREIDTSGLKPWELKARIVEIYEPGLREKNMQIRFLSFGFKYGLPTEADLVFDVRFLPNPYYVTQLKPLTGEDSRVRDYLWRWAETGAYFKLVREMLEFSIPYYIKEGKTSLVVAIGCTGGKHRSVVFADELGKTFGSIYNLLVEHRDINKS